MFTRKFLEGFFLLMDKAGDDGGAGGGTGDTPPNDKPNDDPNPGDDGGDPKPKEDPPGDDLDESGWDDKTKAYIKKLRGENAKYRTKAKDNETAISKLKTEQNEFQSKLKKAFGLEEEDEVKPEEKISNLTSENDNLRYKNAVMMTAIENGISNKDQMDYFEFLMTKAIDELPEDQDELSEDGLKAVVDKVKAMGQGTTKPSTSVSGNNGGNQDPGKRTPPANDGGTITVEQFAAMNFGEKSQLYTKNPELYKSLNSQAQSKGLI